MVVGKLLKRVWHFIWYDDSLLSWVVNLILAFILVKFLIYPGIGFVLDTDFPIVAVVSGSMEHDGLRFEEWWEENGKWYSEQGISKDEYKNFLFKNGFNKGDIMFLKGVEPKNINRGDVIVYEITHNRNPIIHRIVEVRKSEEGYEFITRGDNNNKVDKPVGEGQIERTGKAIFRLPFLGWVKIWFVGIFS
jgi:signal peptidase I